MERAARRPPRLWPLMACVAALVDCACHGQRQLDKGKVQAGERQNLPARRGGARKAVAVPPPDRCVTALARPRLTSSPYRPFVVLAVSGVVMGRCAPSQTSR